MNQQKYNKWDRWISYIVFTVKKLIESRYLYNEIQKIEKNHPNLPENNIFFHWIKDNYINNVTLLICRLRDNHKDCISFYKLLNEIKKFPELLSRDRFLSITKDINVSEKNATSLFNKLAGKYKKNIDSLQVQLDLCSFLEKSEKIQDYRDNVIAHTDKREFENWFCEFELDECINQIEKLAIKYRTFFRGNHIESLLPSLNKSWKDIFKIPWIQS